MFSEESFSLSPASFFQVSASCYYLPYQKESFPCLPKQKEKKYLLPDTSALCGEEAFAQVKMGWNEEGLEFLVEVDQPYQQSLFPNFTGGDSFEVMIDTRNVKTSGYNTRFCHHFFFLPESIDGKQAGEITKFRTEDAHELCDPLELKVNFQKNVKNYFLKIFIPASCLHGYDPEQFDKLGFTYRINRYGEAPQHFSTVSKDYQIEQQPSLWSQLKLIR